MLLERYGHLGGMCTGGLVNIIPNLSDVYGTRYIGGICEEFINRMDAQGACTRPVEADFAFTDPAVLKYYKDCSHPPLLCPQEQGRKGVPHLHCHSLILK